MFYTNQYRIVKWAGTYTVQRQRRFLLWHWWTTQGRYLGGSLGGEAWMDWAFTSLDQAMEYVNTRLLKDHSIALRPEIVYYSTPTTN